MKNSLIEELYKFRHQKTLLYGIVVLLILMIYGGITSKVDQSVIAFGFGAGQWIPIIVIAVGSAFFAMEYSNNTIIILLYKKSKKYNIYLSKLIVIFLYGILLTVISTLFTFVLKFILVGNKFSWLLNYNGRGSVLSILFFNMLGTIIYVAFIVGLSFMLIMLVKINAVVIGIGLAICFLGASISIALMKTFNSLVGIIKWNPLNMIFVTQQLSNNSYSKVSHLNNLQISIGTIIYALIFIIIGYLIFKKRRV